MLTWPQIRKHMPWRLIDEGFFAQRHRRFVLHLQTEVEAIHITVPSKDSAHNPYEDTTFMNGFIGVAQMRPFNGNPTAALNSVAITDVDACVFYSLCGTQGGQPILRTSSTGYFLMSDLNRRDAAGARIFTPVTPNDVRFIINGPGAAHKFGTPFGNVGRNTFRGDRIETVDFSVFKTFHFTERINLQYRLEMINALNHPIFGTPNSINVNNLNFFNFQEQSGGRRANESVSDRAVWRSAFSAATAVWMSRSRTAASRKVLWAR